MVGLFTRLLLEAGQNSWRWSWRLYQATRGFSFVSANGMAVHFKPRKWDELDVDLFLMCCRHARNDLARRFGFRVGWVRAFLFDDPEVVAKLIDGRSNSGFALPGADWIVLARCEIMEEVARHELVHLYAARWNTWAPPLLSEGLAVWLQRFYWGRPIDNFAREIARRCGPLAEIDTNRFYEREHRDLHYVLAGSFTGYLLRHYDWERYRKLYRRAMCNTFKRSFKEIIGISLQEAEDRWRAELRYDNVVKIVR